jgi:hypothetical protein
MIRHYEKEVEELRRIRPRVPIIAVSASLTENSRFDYVQTGYVLYSPVQYGHTANPLVTVLMPGS